MSGLANQMQQSMNRSLETARIDTMIKNAQCAMLDAAARIEKRPSLKGCDALEKTQSHDVVRSNKNDDGFQLMGMAMGGGGVLETVADVALDQYSNRKATKARPQDEEKLEPKEEAKIRQDNLNDMKLFFALSDKLDSLNLLKETCSYDDPANKNGHWNAVIDTQKDEIVGVKFEQYGMTPKFNPNMTPEQLAKFEAKNAKDRIQFTQSGISKKHDLTMSPEDMIAFEHDTLEFAKPNAPKPTFAA